MKISTAIFIAALLTCLIVVGLGSSEADNEIFWSPWPTPTLTPTPKPTSMLPPPPDKPPVPTPAPTFTPTPVLPPPPDKPPCCPTSTPEPKPGNDHRRCMPPVHRVYLPLFFQGAGP